MCVNIYAYIYACVCVWGGGYMCVCVWIESCGYGGELWDLV